MHLITSTTIFGVGLDAYIIIAILGIPIFFIWRRFFRKRIKGHEKKIIIVWITTIFSALIIYLTLVILWFFCGTYYFEHNFNRDGWMNNKDERYVYSHDIIDNKILIGKTKPEVEKLLGNDHSKDTNIWFYDLGFTPGSIDPDSMEIVFKDGKVVNVVQHKHH